jgi:hypothetical protein
MEEKDLKENVIEEKTRQWMKNFPVILATRVYRKFLEYIANFAPKDCVSYTYKFLLHNVEGSLGSREIRKSDDKESFFICNDLEIPYITYMEDEDNSIDVVLYECKETNIRIGWLMFPTGDGYYDCYEYIDCIELKIYND